MLIKDIESTCSCLAVDLALSLIINKHDPALND